MYHSMLLRHSISNRIYRHRIGQFRKPGRVVLRGGEKSHSEH